VFSSWVDSPAIVPRLRLPRGEDWGESWALEQTLTSTSPFEKGEAA